MLTHYIYLAAFAWMALEGIQLYRLVIVIFETGSSYVKTEYVGAYGIPAIIVGVTALVAYLKGDNACGGDCLYVYLYILVLNLVYSTFYVYSCSCWLVDDYSWSFFGPALLILLVI